MKIPAEKVRDFAKFYKSLFTKKGDRPDFMDRGSEYRHMIGIPGGEKSVLFKPIKEIMEASSGKDEPSITVLVAKGDDSDNLGKHSVWIYDSDQFKFHQAEIYH